MQRVSRIAGGIGLAAAALVVMMVGWSRMNQPVRAPSVQPAEGRVMGDLTGFVGRVDQKARTVEVAEKLGLRPITMTVTDDTAITVHGEQRGLRDLKKDLPVRAFYEVRNDVTYLTKIQVVTDETQARPAEAKPMTLPPVAAAPAPAVSSTKQSATFRPAPPPAQAPVVATAPAPAPAPAAARAPASTGAPLVPPIAPAPPLTPVAEAPAPPRQTVSAGPVAADAGDGSEAVDWLLRNSRRR